MDDKWRLLESENKLLRRQLLQTQSALERTSGGEPPSHGAGVPTRTAAGLENEAQVTAEAIVNPRVLAAVRREGASIDRETAGALPSFLAGAARRAMLASRRRDSNRTASAAASSESIEHQQRRIEELEARLRETEQARGDLELALQASHEELDRVVESEYRTNQRSMNRNSELRRAVERRENAVLRLREALQEARNQVEAGRLESRRLEAELVSVREQVRSLTSGDEHQDSETNAERSEADATKEQLALVQSDLEDLRVRYRSLSTTAREQKELAEELLTRLESYIEPLMASLDRAGGQLASGSPTNVDLLERLRKALSGEIPDRRSGPGDD